MMDNLQCGWLSPEGEFMPCKPFDHCAAAVNLIERYRIPLRYAEPEDDALIDHGFVKIGIWRFVEHCWNIIWNPYLSLTYEQKSFLAPYFDKERDGLHASHDSETRWLMELNGYSELDDERTEG